MFFVVDWGACFTLDASGMGAPMARAIATSVAWLQPSPVTVAMIFSRGTPTFFFFLAAKSLDSSIGSSFGLIGVAGLRPSASRLCTKRPVSRVNVDGATS